MMALGTIAQVWRKKPFGGKRDRPVTQSDRDRPLALGTIAQDFGKDSILEERAIVLLAGITTLQS